jgi:hypothetical protein
MVFVAVVDCVFTGVFISSLSVYRVINVAGFCIFAERCTVNMLVLLFRAMHDDVWDVDMRNDQIV